MASQAQMDRLIGRALFSPEFRTLLLQDPEKAARMLRYRLDSDQVARIRTLEPEILDKLAQDFDAAIESPRQGLTFW